MLSRIYLLNRPDSITPLTRPGRRFIHQLDERIPLLQCPQHGMHTNRELVTAMLIADRGRCDTAIEILAMNRGRHKRLGKLINGDYGSAITGTITDRGEEQCNSMHLPSLAGRPLVMFRRSL